MWGGKILTLQRIIFYIKDILIFTVFTRPPPSFYVWNFCKNYWIGNNNQTYLYRFFSWLGFVSHQCPTLMFMTFLLHMRCWLDVTRRDDLSTQKRASNHAQKNARKGSKSGDFNAMQRSWNVNSEGQMDEGKEDLLSLLQMLLHLLR